MTETADLVELDGWKGYAAWVPFLVPIDSIESHPENPRRGNLDVVAKSLDDYGQTKPIVVQDATSYIVAGNHTRLAALERLGWTQIAVVRAAMTDEEALGYLMADNRSSDLGEYDDRQRIAILERLSDAGKILTTGYTPDDLDDLLAAQAKLAEGASAEFEAGRNDDSGGGSGETSSDRLNELVCLYNDEQFQGVRQHMKILQREWRMGAQSEVVAEALRRAAAAS